VTGGDFSVAFGSFQTNYAFSRFLNVIDGSANEHVETPKLQVPTFVFVGTTARTAICLFIYTVGQQFASLVAANPTQFTQNRFAIKWTYSFAGETRPSLNPDIAKRHRRTGIRLNTYEPRRLTS